MTKKLWFLKKSLVSYAQKETKNTTSISSRDRGYLSKLEASLSSNIIRFSLYFVVHIKN